MTLTPLQQLQEERKEIDRKIIRNLKWATWLMAIAAVLQAIAFGIRVYQDIYGN